MEHFNVHINLLCMCFGTIPSNGHTSLSTALVYRLPKEFSEIFFACVVCTCVFAKCILILNSFGQIIITECTFGSQM